jgi:hypothetical protein
VFIQRREITVIADYGGRLTLNPSLMVLDGALEWAALEWEGEEVR